MALILFLDANGGCECPCCVKLSRSFAKEKRSGKSDEKRQSEILTHELTQVTEAIETKGAGACVCV